jgi:AbrB family looped-hinge helix DNA binding protein
MGISKVTRNWQITLPKDVRETLHIKEGERLLIKTENDRAIIEKLKKDWVERVFGAWGPSKESGVEYVRKMRREWEEREKRLRR